MGWPGARREAGDTRDDDAGHRDIQAVQRDLLAVGRDEGANAPTAGLGTTPALPPACRLSEAQLMVFTSVPNSVPDSVATWAGERTLRAQLLIGIWPGEQERYRSAEVSNAQALVAAVSAA